MSSEYARRWSIGIIACSSSKRPDGINPLTLYKGSMFSVTVTHAAPRCKRILIMSAKYGLLDLADPIRWYDVYLGNLNADEREALMLRIQGQQKIDPGVEGPILSYLPHDYHALLMESMPWLKSITHRPYAGLPMMRFVKTLSNEVKHYGTEPSRR